MRVTSEKYVTPLRIMPNVAHSLKNDRSPSFTIDWRYAYVATESGRIQPGERNTSATIVCAAKIHTAHRNRDIVPMIALRHASHARTDRSPRRAGAPRRLLRQPRHRHADARCELHSPR